MNDLDLMERFRADLPPADPATLTRARARMFHEPPARRPVRWAWRLAPAAALAAAVTVAVAVVATRAPGPEQATPVPGPGQALPGPGRDQGTNAPDAARVLLLAAAEARREPTLPARPDQFVYVESRAAWADGGGSYHPPVEKNRRVWLSVDGSQTGLLRQTPDKDLANMPLDSGFPAYRKDLPTDAKAMHAYLYAGEKNKNPADVRAFTLIGDTLREQYVPPASVAALFEAGSTIPGTTVVRQADLAGRKGTAVSRTYKGIRHELIFDSATYHFLGERDVVVGNAPPYPRNAVIGWTAQLRIAIVDKAGQLP